MSKNGDQNQHDPQILISDIPQQVFTAPDIQKQLVEAVFYQVPGFDAAAVATAMRSTSNKWQPETQCLILEIHDISLATGLRLTLTSKMFWEGAVLSLSWDFGSSGMKKIADEDHSHDHLMPPTREKMFLISPPSSPPIGWTSRFEDGPIPVHQAHSDSLENIVKLESFTLEENMMDTFSQEEPILAFSFADPAGGLFPTITVSDWDED